MEKDQRGIICDRHGSVRIAGVRVHPKEYQDLQIRLRADRSLHPTWRLSDLVRRALARFRLDDTRQLTKRD